MEKTTGNLPSEVAYVIKEDPTHENILYAGLYRAVYISTDRGTSWSLLGKNMPAAAVSDLEIDVQSGDLVASTHGRGIYKLNLIPIYEKITLNKVGDFLFDQPIAKLPFQDNNQNGVNYRTLTKVPITFWMTKSELVTIRLVNDKGENVWSIEFIAKRGYNQYRWNMISNHVESPLPYFINYNQFIGKGMYQLQIKTSTANLTTSFEVE
ncbi:MAG: hypothetical protein HC811_06080 [Flammeovirgaceae bacterium]|nr:hypothetical protein [Flammeovirgaceae bacterium]